MIYLIIILIVTSIILFIIRKITQKITYTNVIAIFGGVKSGKTLLAVKIAIKQFKHSQKFTKKYNNRQKILNKFRKKEKRKELLLPPQFYSTTPIYINKKYGMSLKPTKELLLSKTKASKGSIFLLDEFGAIASQYGYTEEQMRIDISEFVRFFGQYYGKNSLLLIIDHSLDRILKEVRVSLGNVYETSEFKKVGIIAKNKVIKYINGSQTEFLIQKEQIKSQFYIIIKKHYDPEAYSIRYDYIENESKQEESRRDLKETELLRLDNLKSSLDKKIKKETKQNQKNN